MKVSTKQLQEMVRTAVKTKLQELKRDDVVPGDAGKLGKYAEDVDKFLMESIEKIDELVEEAEEMMRMNLLSQPQVGDRNRSLMSRVGILRALKQRMIDMLEATHRTV